MKISEIIKKLINFDHTERPAFVKLYIRNADGDVLEVKRWPVENVFSHNKDYADNIIEDSQVEQSSL